MLTKRRERGGCRLVEGGCLHIDRVRDFVESVTDTRHARIADTAKPITDFRLMFAMRGLFARRERNLLNGRNRSSSGAPFSSGRCGSVVGVGDGTDSQPSRRLSMVARPGRAPRAKHWATFATSHDEILPDLRSC
jgi:hypothetical protein